MTVMIHNWLLDVLVVLLALAIPLQLGFPGYGAYPPVDSRSVGVPRRWHWTSRASSTFGSRGLHAVRTWRLWRKWEQELWHTMTYDILWLYTISSKSQKHAERERDLHTHTRKSVQVIVRLPTERSAWLLRKKTLHNFATLQVLRWSMMYINDHQCIIWSWMIIYDLLWSCLQVYAKEVRHSLLSRFMSLGYDGHGTVQCIPCRKAQSTKSHKSQVVRSSAGNIRKSQLEIYLKNFWTIDSTLCNCWAQVYFCFEGAAMLRAVRSSWAVVSELCFFLKGSVCQILMWRSDSTQRRVDQNETIGFKRTRKFLAVF